MKRTRDDVSPFPFTHMREREMFEHDRNILARIIYKNGHQFRRHDFLFRMKKVIRLCDELIDGQLRNSEADTVITTIQKAAEWWYQQLCMGHMLPQALTIVACLGRLADLLRRITSGVHSTNACDYGDDEGVPVDS